MSYIVTGEDRPEGCRVCDFRAPRAYGYFCPKIHKFIPDYEAEHRAEGCPLKPIGRTKAEGTE